MATMTPKRHEACTECGCSFPIYRDRGDMTKCKACKMAARTIAYRLAHPDLRAKEYAKWKARASTDDFEAKRARGRKLHAENPKMSAIRMNRWREKNRERARATYRAYYQANRQKCIQYVVDRNASFRTPPWASKADIAKLYHAARRVSEVTGVLHHVDHVIPLRGRKVCGLHVHTNLRVIAAEDNWRKHATFEVEA